MSITLTEETPGGLGLLGPGAIPGLSVRAILDILGELGELTEVDAALAAASAPASDNPFLTASALSAGIQTVQRHLSSAEINQLMTSPVELVADPAGTNIVQPISMYLRLQAGAMGWTFAARPILKASGSGVEWVPNARLAGAGGVLPTIPFHVAADTAVSVSGFVCWDGDALAIASSGPLVLTASADPAGVGDGTAWLVVTYVVFPANG